MKDDYMKSAIKEAYKAYKNNEVPVGAVIVKNDKIISKAYNRKEERCCVIEHAEINAIIKASKKLQNWRLNGCDMYVTLEPCPMCASAIKQARIDHVYYLFDSTSCENKKIVKEIFTNIDANKPVENIKMNYDFDNINFITFFFKKQRSETNVLDR
ncbi:MAG TPA: nucleoside deaminase [Candidatus Onthousia faecavium]|nr:nucleoside deaminase [Candidatus Onthousia faecavium]